MSEKWSLRLLVLQLRVMRLVASVLTGLMRRADRRRVRLGLEPLDMDPLNTLVSCVGYCDQAIAAHEHGDAVPPVPEWLRERLRSETGDD